MDKQFFERARFQEIPRIQGFRAIKVWYETDRPDPNHRCRVYVDVVGGQSLRVEVDESFVKGIRRPATRHADTPKRR
ncbi:hypothetical protein JOF55_002261 [Haloactinomyces albus]|uniref:Uncharacterized protein n=1 Tax=Haloactinomyces albus TaxID=1352928 RepID=A0AAE4CLA7_9ACTN|nr:hypothetical protein [Haloactinomyces albus]